MSEATINIPAERVADVRYQLQVSMSGEAEQLGRFESWSTELDVTQAAVVSIRILEAMMDQIGWGSGDPGPRQLTTDVDLCLLPEAIGRGVEYAQDDVARAAGDEVDTAIERLQWFKSTLDSLEPEAGARLTPVT